jgi:D-alanyl-D-alanine carboxypeptidase
MSAQRLIDRYVADPLGLDDTQLPGAEAAPAGDPVLPGYLSNGEDRENGCTAPADRTELSASMGFTDSGVTSTITDLARYGQALAVEATDDDGELRDRWAHPFSFGTAEYAGGAYLHGTMIGQQGRMPGYLTSVYADTETGMTVAVVLNNSAGSKQLPAALAKELAAIASKAPAADGHEQPQFGLPWTAEQYRETVTDMAVCPIG